MTINAKGVIEQKIGGVDHPLLTVRPRYVADQKNGVRGRRARLRILDTKKVLSGTGGVSNSVRNSLIGKGFTSFLITGVSYSFSEKMQVTETFGDSVTAFAFGAAPVVLNINGVVVDDLDNDWFVRLIYAYKDYIRATKLAKNFELVRLDMPNGSFIGSVINLGMSQDSANDAAIGFTMQFLVRSFQFYSTQGFDDALLAKEIPLEAIGTDGTMTQESLNALKKNKTALGPFQSISGYIGDLAKSFPSVGGFGSSIHGIVEVGNSVTESELVKKAIEFGHKVEGAADAYNLVKRGLDQYKKTQDKTPRTGRPYTLSVIGTYSAALDYAGEPDPLSEFLGDTQRNLDYLSGVLDTITKSKAGKLLLKGKNRDKVKGLIKDAKNLSKMVGSIKAMTNVYDGILAQGVAAFDSIKEVGKAFKGMFGAVAAAPTTAVDKLASSGGLATNIPIFVEGGARAISSRSLPDLTEVLAVPRKQPPVSVPLKAAPALTYP